MLKTLKESLWFGALTVELAKTWTVYKKEPTRRKDALCLRVWNKDDVAVLKRYIARKRCNLANDPLRKLQKEMRHLRREFQCKQSKFENFCASRNKECAVNCMFETFIATVSGLIQTQWTIHCQKAVMQ